MQREHGRLGTSAQVDLSEDYPAGTYRVGVKAGAANYVECTASCLAKLSQLGHVEQASVHK